MYKGTLQVFLLGCLCIVQPVFGDDWWENANFYQVYLRSFHDSNGDGIGDLKGVTQRLDHLAYLGINGIWLSPVFPSPMKDFGYDITDYRGVHYEYGTMADFDELLNRCHELNIKLVLDFVPNHSSDQHEWFVASADPAHPDHDKYKDFYVWHDGEKAADGTIVGPPSNWLSIFRRSAWTLHPKRNQYYLHQFLPEQPDLNFRNDAALNEMEDVLRFWFDKGIDGFRVDAIPFMYESKENQTTGRYDDEPKTGWCQPDEHCSLDHVHTSNVDETYELVYRWRKISDSYNGTTRILMTECYTPLEENIRYYGGMLNDEFAEGAQIPFNFEFMCRTHPDSNAIDFENTLWSWMNSMPKREGIHANWVLGNHDQRRFTSKYGPKRTDLFNILQKTLPGISITYYGEEIGMTNVYISWEDTVDPQACRTNPEMFDSVSRDPSRTPLQWDASQNAGFSTAAKTWLPLAENYATCNIAQQKVDKYSHLKVFRSLLQLREEPAMRYGELTTNVFGSNVLVYKRELVDEPTGDIYFFILNFGREKVSVPLASLLYDVPAQLKVIIASIHSDSLIPGEMVSSAFITIDPEVGAAFVGRKESVHRLPEPQWWREQHNLAMPRKLKGISDTSAYRT